MTETSQQIQLALLSIVVTVITLGSFAFILWKQPDSLRMSRDGVPYFTPAVIHPDSGNTVTVDELVQHYKAQE